MSQPALTKSNGWGGAGRTGSSNGPAADLLLRVVDAGLCGVICVAPFFFGGRHDFGRLVLATLIAVTAAAWFVRQALLPSAPWIRTAVHGIILAAVVLLALQLVPLPVAWLQVLAPRTPELLPLWTADGGAAQLGTWNTLSLMPHESAKSLAMLVSYGLLFTVVIGRVASTADVRRLLRVTSVASVLMAVFGLFQYFTSDGRFFWFYEHPYRSTQFSLCGSFINRNHFASFLVLGVGPLAAWLLELVAASSGVKSRRGPRSFTTHRIAKWLVAAALALVVCAVLRSLSRGGAAALLTAATVLVAIGWSRRLLDSRFVYGLVGFAAVVVGLLSVYGYNQVAERLDDFTQGSIDVMDQHEGRRRVWAANAAAIEAGWLTGSGAGTHAEICPVYLPESLTWEYTHAECGYLQVATENGVLGEALLLAGIGLCGWWCFGCFRRATSASDVLCFAACAAGLAASVVHSAVDFVWYIPACMSVTVVLAGCVLRLSQPACADDKQPGPAWQMAWPRARWLEAAAVVVLASAWTVYTYVGPGMASFYWDRYLRASVANREAARQQMADSIASRPSASAVTAELLNDVMLRQLERVVAWDPQFARAQLRLAAAYIAQFESRQRLGENTMTLPQIQDAVLASQFRSAAELRAWLHRAFGNSAELLYRADAGARRAVALCPLQGEAYVFLGELSFLSGRKRDAGEAYFAQALRVRPHDGDVLYEIGKQNLLDGQVASALDLWQECFVDRGPHQMKIVYLLAGRIPAQMFLAKYSPDWQTLGEIWTRYRLLGQPQDLEQLITYAAAAARRETLETDGPQPMRIWQALAGMYSNLDRPNESLACLQRAYACNPRHFGVRFALADALLKAGRYAEAEAHVRWCLARRPEQKNLSAALVTIAKQQLAAREAAGSGVQQAIFDRAE